MCWSKGDSGSPFNRKIMDYEKKYKEALERVRRLHDRMLVLSSTDALVASSELEFIFPELAESEDEGERIRKSLVQTLQLAKRNDGKLGISNTLADKYLAWLEKQKGPLPIPDKFSELNSLLLQYFQSAVNRKDDTEIESDTDLWGRKILDYVWKHDEKPKESLGDFIDDFPYSDEQKEQKPKEQCVDVIKMSTLLAADRLASAEMTGRFKERKEILENPEKYGLCKPAECEDCAMYLSGNCIHPNGKCENVKSKQEWSEEDKRKLNRIYEILGQAADEKPFGSSKRIIGDKEAVELQDFIKLLRPSWKPSEVQMDALEAATVRYQSTGLESLYEELKKLM